MENVIRKLAIRYRDRLKNQTDSRIVEMEQDDNSHRLMYKILGIDTSEGSLIDKYHNKGRFLYKYAGSFLEEAAVACFRKKFPDCQPVRIFNSQGQRPKVFSVDCLVQSKAIEFKWRDATTDGDHILKEQFRIQSIFDAGYQPIRVMFFNPNRQQAKKVQKTLENLYKKLAGEYYSGINAWKYIFNQTGVDLLHILEKLSTEDIYDAKTISQ